MAKLKFGAIESDKPVKLTITLPAPVHRDLVAYAQVLAREPGLNGLDPAKLIAHAGAFHGDRSRLCQCAQSCRGIDTAHIARAAG